MAALTMTSALCRITVRVGRPEAPPAPRHQACQASDSAKWRLMRNVCGITCAVLSGHLKDAKLAPLLATANVILRLDA